MTRLKDFPKIFWIANTMEIFERMAWYGFFAVSSLYITGAVEDGGLGFSDEDRGVLQGVVIFFLYLFPVVTGSIADRYGFKKMLFYSFVILAPAYYLLGQFKTFPTFFLAFMFVAIGAAMFKPVIVGTVAKSTNSKTSSMGFGIFYMMVNIGGFIGPIVAAIVRGWAWKWVFVASAGWIVVNMIFVTIFFKEPTSESKSENPRTLKKVLTDMVEVLGNGRFFLFVSIILLALVLGSKLTSMGFITWNGIFGVCFLWLLINVIYDFIIKKTRGAAQKSWFLQPIKLGDWRFGLFLLLMSGFWISFNQLFLTLPLYIRDYTDTSGLLNNLIGMFQFFGLDTIGASIKDSMAVSGQINPEYLIGLNFGSIMLFQVVVSYFNSRLKPFTTIAWGVAITVASMIIFVFGSAGWIVVLGIVVFSFGEMMASPKAQEYTGSIAPPNKVALYMGYFFWSMALGKLFGGLLSGQLYAAFGRDSHRPDIMWIIFAVIALASALLMFFLDKVIIKRENN